MTIYELAAICSKPERRASADFADVLQQSLLLLGIYQSDLARAFEVAESTVSRWAKGIARPHPAIQKLVLAWIGKRAAKLASAQKAEELQLQPLAV